MDCSKSGFPVHHQLLELTQTHVHPVSDVIQSSHPLSSPSPPAFNLSQHQGLFQSQFFASGGQICLLHQVVNMLITILLIFSLYLSFFHATYFFLQKIIKSYVFCHIFSLPRKILWLSNVSYSAIAPQFHGWLLCDISACRVWLDMALLWHPPVLMEDLCWVLP